MAHGGQESRDAGELVSILSFTRDSEIHYPQEYCTSPNNNTKQSQKEGEKSLSSNPNHSGESLTNGQMYLDDPAFKLGTHFKGTVA